VGGGNFGRGGGRGRNGWWDVMMCCIMNSNELYAKKA
jgi:hypothetical protein